MGNDDDYILEEYLAGEFDPAAVSTSQHSLPKKRNSLSSKMGQAIPSTTDRHASPKKRSSSVKTIEVMKHLNGFSIILYLRSNK